MCEEYSDHGHEHHHHHHHHDHDHAHEGSASPEQSVALLSYMVAHNKSHVEEMLQVAHIVENEQAHELMHEAAELLEQGNEKLAQALALLQEKGE